MSAAREFLHVLLSKRLPEAAALWLATSEGVVARLPAGPGTAFATLYSQASRRIPRGDLAPTADERGRAHEVLEGWNPERWTLHDAARALLVLARTDLARPEGVAALEDCFAYADVGESCSLHRVLCLLPSVERFVWRAGEGCRSSMRVVYEAAACDTPLPVRHFDDLAWRQLVIKAVFVGAPLWRVYGLDTRLDAELARMALDLVEERRAAGRRVQPELWLCLGRFGGPRGEASLERELAGDWAPGRRAASLALVRAGRIDTVREAFEREPDPAVRSTIGSALRGRIHQSAWSELHGLE
ncbi:MAG: EboA domain-containing protein [Planctomycetota bacterium]|nr:EboA domain-containing protein [Planctomycetota bacterium]